MFHEGYLDTLEGTGSIAQELYICLSSSILQANDRRGIRCASTRPQGHRAVTCGLMVVAQSIFYLIHMGMEAMMTGKLSPEGEEVIAAYGAAMVAAFQVLISCLEENDAVLAGTVS